ncbi:MAG: hypothetical protein FJ368_04350 [Pelagibacterales bacterium]|nr:hypothetical protein [Pelagibacterales bacterium]
MFLLFVNSVIPVFGYFFIGFSRSSKLNKMIFKLLPVLFLMNLFGLSAYANKGANLEIFNLFSNTTFGFNIDKLNFLLLLSLGLIWITFVFHINQISKFLQEEITDNLKLKITASFALLNCLIISNNLLTTLFFYSFLLLLNHFFAKDFLYEKNSKLCIIPKLSFYLQSFLFFVAVVLNDKFFGNVSFLLQNNSQHLNLLVLYFVALFFIFLIPYLFYQSFKSSNIALIYISFFVISGFGSLVIFTKILKTIFASSASNLIVSSIFHYFLVIVFTIILINAVLMIFSKNLKASFFYLISNQILLSAISITIFASFDNSKIYLPIVSSALSNILILLSFSNFNFYIEKLKLSSIKGMFDNLKISSIFLIFALLNVLPLFPAISLYEKFFVIKAIFQKELLWIGIIFVLNFFFIFVLGCKLSYFLLSKIEGNTKNIKSSDENYNQNKQEDLTNFELSLNLIPFAVLFIMIVLPIFLQFKIGIFAL